MEHLIDKHVAADEKARLQLEKEIREKMKKKRIAEKTVQKTEDPKKNEQ
jgi:hypothetical protein